MPQPVKKKFIEVRDPAAPLFLGLMIIMLAFFIVLNSMATQDEIRTLKALESIAFGFGTSGGSNRVIDLNYQDSSLKEPMSMEKRLRRMVRDVFLSQRDLRDQIHFMEDERKLILTLDGLLTFGNNRSALNPVVFPILDRLASIIRTTSQPVYIQGHAEPDGSPNRNYNYILAAKRAWSVYTYLLESGRIPSHLLVPESFGDLVPPRKNALSKNAPEWRRVNLVFYKDEVDVRR